MRIGVHRIGVGVCEFTVWAPLPTEIALHLVSPEERIIPMERDAVGYARVRVEGVSADALYCYRLDGNRDRPDPASLFQPQGVHGPSQVVDPGRFPWTDGAWRGIPLEAMILYELHVGTFTPEGTFDAAAARLDDLRGLGITAIEIMPVSQFPGARNWGYDGVHPFSVQNTYGGPEGLARFVDAAHARGMAVILDVVYNHLGPEGNYLQEFGRYFTARYQAPWGMAINFDGPESDEVRRFFIKNALHWFRDFHIDALRIDAIHGVYDFSATPFLEELSKRVDTLSAEHGRPFLLIAESDLNDVRCIRRRDEGGLGLHAQWNDDFHHALHTLLTPERDGYYADFGRTAHLAKALREGFIYSGQHSRYRQRRHGNSSAGRPAHQLVVFAQNHDQVGNRMRGERLSTLVPFEALKLAAGAVLLSPAIPLLFMGEEYGEEAPFHYFVSHLDPALVEAVRAGRKKEFEHFGWSKEPPDPQAEKTFLESKLSWERRDEGYHGMLCAFHRKLIALRKDIPAIAAPDGSTVDVVFAEEEKLLFFERHRGTNAIACLLNAGPADGRHSFPFLGTGWKKVLDSADKRWGGPGSGLPEEISATEELLLRPYNVALYERGTR